MLPSFKPESASYQDKTSFSVEETQSLAALLEGLIGGDCLATSIDLDPVLKEPEVLFNMYAQPTSTRSWIDQLIIREKMYTNICATVLVRMFCTPVVSEFVLYNCQQPNEWMLKVSFDPDVKLFTLTTYGYGTTPAVIAEEIPAPCTTPTEPTPTNE